MSPEGGPALQGWRPEAVVFDCDGLLVDTEPCWTVAETALFASRGLPFGPSQKALLIGKSIGAVGEVMAEVFGEDGKGAQLAEELLGMVEEAVRSSAQAMPGAHHLLDLAMARVPVAVASNSPRRLLDAALARAGLADAFAISVAADEVVEAKPAPDMYLAACRALGRLPGRCVAFEDSMTGLRSALGAGLRTVGVPTLLHDDFPADLVVSSLEDASLLRWVEGW